MKVLLIGHGYWGRKLHAGLDNILGSADVLISDIETAAFAFPACPRRNVHEAARDFTSLLGKVDACVIATLPGTHYEIAKACLEAGKSCLVEKPLTTNHGQARELYELARRRGLTLMVDDTWFYHKDFWQKLCEIPLSSRVCGSMIWAGPEREETKESVLWSLGPHPVSLALSWLAHNPTLRGGNDIGIEVKLAVETYSREEVAFRLSVEGRGLVDIFLSWRAQRKNRFVFLCTWPNTDFRYVALDGARLSYEEGGLTPLDRMLERFIENAYRGIIEARPVEVVRILENVEKGAGGIGMRSK